ncbi:MAG: hypothetical protein ABW194_11930 [Novosphingobium sp.]
MVLPAPRVLVLEDSVLVAMAIEAALADCGVEAVVAGGLAAARDRLSRGPVDAALLDLQLPDGNSLGLARDLTARGCPVALCSGVDSGALPAEYPAAQRFFKPVGADVLAQWVASVIADRDPDRP